MIIGSYVPFEMGKVYNDAFVWDKNLVEQQVSFKVIRIATLEEYIKQVEEYEAIVQDWEAAKSAYYYEVWID